MLIKVDKHCSILFGNAALFSVGFKNSDFPSFCDNLRKNMGLDTLIFNKQVHGTEGKVVTCTSPQGTLINVHNDDWHATQSLYVGLGILTADCLPIVFYEPKNRIIASAHAGWKGSVQRIVHTVLKKLGELSPHTPQIFFGPSAQSCCYEIQDDFIAHIEQNSHGLQSVVKRDGKMFFDNTQFNKKQLAEMGINPENIHTAHNVCTVCNHQFHSYRRAEDKSAYKSQGTIVWLKN